MLAGLGTKQLRLVRNPHFHEWSRAARPDGYPDEIVIALRGKLDDSDAIRAVDAGKLDWFSWSEPGILPKLLLRYRSRLHVNPWRGTVYMSLNTRVPPFDDVRVRRALNYAVDRDGLVVRLGGRVVATPTCQVLPPSFPGYERSCRYPGPNVAKARSLVTASGTRGMRVAVWTVDLGGQTAKYFVSLLRELGYRASLKVWPLERSLGAYLATIANPRNKVGVAWNAFLPDYPSAENFFQNFRCRASPLFNSARFCSRRVDALIERARALQTSDPQAANALLAQIDSDVMNQAPWVPTINPNFVSLVSKRVGNYQYAPPVGLLIDQLWVR
jgi:peptide/nickel transport system substrate-binding protein